MSLDNAPRGEDFTYCFEFGGEVTRDGTDGKRFVAKGAPAPMNCP